MIISKETIQNIIAHLQEPEIVIKTSIFFCMSNQDRSLDLTIDYIEPQCIHITDDSLQIGGTPEVYSISLPVDNIDMTDVVSDGRISEQIMRFVFLSESGFTASLIVQIDSSKIN